MSSYLWNPPGDGHGQDPPGDRHDGHRQDQPGDGHRWDPPCDGISVCVCVCVHVCDYVPTSPACTCLHIFECVYFQDIFDLMLSSSFDMDIIHATSTARTLPATGTTATTCGNHLRQQPSGSWSHGGFLSPHSLLPLPGQQESPWTTRELQNSHLGRI